MGAKIKYNIHTLATCYEGRKVTLKCSGKVMAADIVVEVGNHSTEGLAYEISDDGTYYTCSGIGTATDTDIVIASDLDGIPVTSIGERAFYDYDNLTSVTIPNGVTSIGESAFEQSHNIQSLVMGNSVTSIGKDAFSGCDNLTSVTIPDSVTSIGERAFYGCNNLTSVTIPDSVTSIGKSAFRYCSGLISVIIKKGVTYIGGTVFSDCTGLYIIFYNGTVAEWKAVTKADTDYALNSHVTFVTCTDGTVKIKTGEDEGSDIF